MRGQLTIMVDVLSCLSAEALQATRGWLPVLARETGVRLIVVCGPEQQTGLGLDGLIGVHPLLAPAACQSTAARLVYSSSVVPALAGRLRADVLYSPEGPAPLWAPCAVVMGVGHVPAAKEQDAVMSKRWRWRQTAVLRSLRHGARVAHRLILPNHACVHALASAIPVREKQVAVVYPGVDPGRPPGHGERQALHLLTVGSIHALRNHSVLLEALVLLREQERMTPTLTMVGGASDTEHARYLRRLAQSLGLARQVEFLGPLGPSDLAAQFQRATLFVLPSLSEFNGLSYLQAMANGTPAAVADIPVARELCGDAVEYFPGPSPVALVAVLKRLLKDAGARTRLGQRGLVQAARFSWTRCGSETLSVLREAAEQAGPRPRGWRWLRGLGG